MKKDSERSQGEDGNHLPNAHKSGLKSAHTMVVTQPGADLNSQTGPLRVQTGPLRVHRLVHVLAFGKVCSILHIRKSPFAQDSCIQDTLF